MLGLPECSGLVKALQEERPQEWTQLEQDHLQAVELANYPAQLARGDPSSRARNHSVPFRMIETLPSP